MKSSILLAVAASLLPLAGAWEITWNDASGTNHTKSGHGPSDCIAIDNPKGHVFEIDAQGEQNINMLLFTNSDCSGDPAGMATDEFSKEASKDLLGFKVVSLSSTTASGSSATSTGNSTATGHSAGTATTTTKTGVSSHSASPTGSTSAESKTTQTTVVTSAIVTTSSSASGSASSTSSSVATASTSNAAVRMAVSNADIVKGVMGGIVGLAAWMV